MCPEAHGGHVILTTGYKLCVYQDACGYPQNQKSDQNATIKLFHCRIRPAADRGIEESTRFAQ